MRSTVTRKPATQARPGRRTRRSLSPDAILAVALELALGSPEPLSLSRLGTALGADPTALYRHFHSRDDLLRAMADAVHGQIAVDSADLPDDLPWREALDRHAWNIRRRFLEYPSLAWEYSHRMTGGANEARGVRWVVERLAGLGLSPVEAVTYTKAFAELIFGSISASAGVLTLSPAQQQEELARFDSVYRSVAPVWSPPSADVQVGLAADLDRTFSDALSLMLDGFEVRIARLRPPTVKRASAKTAARAASARRAPVKRGPA